MRGCADDVADRYLEKAMVQGRDQFKLEGTGFTDMRLVNFEGATVAAFSPEKSIFVELSVRIACSSKAGCGFTIYNQLDVPLVLCASEYGRVDIEQGEHTFRVKLPTELLRPGTYRIEGAVWDAHQIYHREESLCVFQIIPASANELLGRSSQAQFVSREPWAVVAGAETTDRRAPYQNI
jgi:lipopolysaccharide transport system ATP-binding protein